MRAAVKSEFNDDTSSFASSSSFMSPASQHLAHDMVTDANTMRKVLEFLNKPPQNPGPIPRMNPARMGSGGSMNNMNNARNPSIDDTFLMPPSANFDQTVNSRSNHTLQHIPVDGSLTDDEYTIDQSILDCDPLGHDARPQVDMKLEKFGNKRKIMPPCGGSRATRRKIVTPSQVTDRADGGRDYCCDVYGCGKTFRDRSGLRKHCDAKHSFICPHADCAHVLNSMDSFLKHMHEHNDAQETEADSNCPSYDQKLEVPLHSPDLESDYLQCDFGLDGYDTSPTSVARTVHDDFPCLDLA
jgi:hypothetical protein